MVRTEIGHQGSGAVQRGQHLAVDVELELLARRVPHPHRRRVLIPREPIDGELAEAALAGRAVHDLQVLGISSNGAQQPVPPRECLIGVTADGE